MAVPMRCLLPKHTTLVLLPPPSYDSVAPRGRAPPRRRGPQPSGHCRPPQRGFQKQARALLMAQLAGYPACTSAHAAGRFIRPPRRQRRRLLPPPGSCAALRPSAAAPPAAACCPSGHARCGSPRPCAAQSAGRHEGEARDVKAGHACGGGGEYHACAAAATTQRQQAAREARHQLL